MRITLTDQERKRLHKLQYIGDEREMGVYDDGNKVMLKAQLTLLCDCGRKRCEHKKLLLLKLLNEYEVR